MKSRVQLSARRICSTTWRPLKPGPNACNPCSSCGDFPQASRNFAVVSMLEMPAFPWNLGDSGCSKLPKFGQIWSKFDPNRPNLAGIEHIVRRSWTKFGRPDRNCAMFVRVRSDRIRATCGRHRPLAAANCGQSRLNMGRSSSDVSRTSPKLAWTRQNSTMLVQTWTSMDRVRRLQHAPWEAERHSRTLFE